MSDLTKPTKPELFVSIDIEADGECPGISSMLSFGVAFFSAEGSIVDTFEANLYPLPDTTPSRETMDWWGQPAQAKAWAYLRENRRTAEEVMPAFAAVVQKWKATHKLCVIGWPINYDWMWIHYYCHRFLGHNPLGFSARCIATYAWALSKNKSSRQKIPDIERWKPADLPHTHRALDDAIEQGATFMGAWMENTSST